MDNLTSRSIMSRDFAYPRNRIQIDSDFLRIYLLICLLISPHFTAGSQAPRISSGSSVGHSHIKTSGATGNSIRIGGVFESEFAGIQLAIQDAVRKVNSRHDIMSNFVLTSDIQFTPVHDSYTTARRVCHVLHDGIAAIFGPMSSVPAAHVSSIAAVMDMPHIEARWASDEPGSLSGLQSMSRDDFMSSRSHDDGQHSLNMFPHHQSLGRAHIDFIRHQQWTSFTFLYETDEGLLRHQGLLKAFSGGNVTLSVRRLDANPRGSSDYRSVLKEIGLRGEYKIMLDCQWYTVQDVLHQAQTINMTTQYHHYHLTTLDVDVIDFEDFRHSGVNITAFSLIDTSRSRVNDVITEWNKEQKLYGNSALENYRGIRTETALMYDAVDLFAKAFTELSRASDITTRPLFCNRTQSWEHGTSLVNYMKMTQIEGLTGTIEFDSRGKRTQFSLTLFELTAKDGMEKVGIWSPLEGINITKKYAQRIEEVTDILKKKVLVVTTIDEDPYVFVRKDPKLQGNDRFEGYCIDLLAEIARMLDFDYVIKLVDDRKYGAPVSGPKDEWNGMVRELMDKKADLAVASLTISYMREQVIDFTKPFMNLGISILFKRPEKTNPSLFSFLSPLSFEIWFYMLAAYLVVSFILFVVARFTPYEWHNPHPCDPDPDLVHNQFSIANSLWFTIGSLMQQGCEIGPRALSTRIVSGIWWFFTLILISSYTANLAAFLTVERMKSPIENADDLSKQSEIKYGTVHGGSTMTFFKTSKIPTYERMWNFMSSTPGVFVNNTKEGVDRVKGGNYAYLLESTMNDYIIQRNCDLMPVGGPLDSKGYGIGTPRGSPYRDLISDAILKLQEDQILATLYNRWWKEKGITKHCDLDEKGKKDANALAIANVGGVFVVLIAGLLLSLIVALLEFVWFTRKRAGVSKPGVEKPSMTSLIYQELLFAVQCCGSSKKRAPNKGGSSSRLTPPTIDDDDDCPLPEPGDKYPVPDPVPLSGAAGGKYPAPDAVPLPPSYGQTLGPAPRGTAGFSVTLTPTVATTPYYSH